MILKKNYPEKQVFFIKVFDLLTIKNCEETLIVSETGSVVLIDQAEWENIQETLRLLHDEESLKALLESHKARDQGVRPDSVSVGEAFYDL